MFSVPVLAFHGPMHGPHRGGFRRRRGCGAPCPAPALFGPRPGGHPLCHRGPFHETPALDGIVDLWRQLAGINDEKKTTNRKPDWTERVKCEGFSPDDTSLSLSEGKLTVNGSSEHSDGAGGHMIRQIKRTMAVPADVDPNSITATFDRSGTLIPSAPRKDPRPQNIDEESKTVTCPAENPPATKLDVSHAEKSTEETCNSCEDCECENANKRENKSECECPEAPDCEMKNVDNKPIEKEENVQTVTCERQLVADKTSKEDMVEPVTKDADQTEPMSVWEERSETMDTDATEAPKETAESAEKEFKLEVDVAHLNPDSIEVKLTSDGLTVTGRRSVTDVNNGGVMTRQILLRRFDVPSDVNTDLLTSTLSEQGQLTIRAPYRRTEVAEGTIIPIRHN